MDLDGLNVLRQTYSNWCPDQPKPPTDRQKSRLFGRPGDGDIHSLAQKASDASLFQIQSNDEHIATVHSLWSVKAAQQSLYRKPTRSSGFLRLTNPQALFSERWPGDGDCLCLSPLPRGGFLMDASTTRQQLNHHNHSTPSPSAKDSPGNWPDRTGQDSRTIHDAHTRDNRLSQLALADANPGETKPGQSQGSVMRWSS